MADLFLPYVRANYPQERVEDGLYRIQAASSLLSYYGLPYSFLLFAMSYKPVEHSREAQRRWMLVLLVPIVLCLIFTPPYNELHPVSHSIVVWWAVPYFIVGAYLVLSKKSYGTLSHMHGIICLAVLPPVIVAMFMSYILPSAGLLRMWKYNVWFVAVGVVMFLIGLFTYGFLGVRVMIDRRRLDSTLRAVTSGTAILHHAIKNDVGKMKLFTEKMQSYAEQTGQAELLEDIRVVQTASSHIQEMISRVHRRTEDLVIQPQVTRLDMLIRDTIAPYEPLLSTINVHISLPEGWQCMIDPAQVGEALNNIIANAIDAMKGSGHLFVSLREGKRELTVEIRDTGPGMDKVQAAKAMEPFYTTKSGKEANFGLGLPYAYYVMRKHGGSLHIRSKLGIGTRIYFTFPKRSVKAVRAESGSTAVIEGGRDEYGSDSSVDR